MTLEPGATIGILGGGQLGRMLAVAAARLGFQVHVFDPDPNAPTAALAAMATHATYDDLDALAAFGAGVDVVTYEFENIPTDALDALEKAAPIYPPRLALATSQDRLVEKDFLTGLGLQTAPYSDASTVDALAAAMETVGAPAILKTRRFGYDGKGQFVIANGTVDPVTAFNQIGSQPAILEGMVRFDREISVIAARGQDGSYMAFEPAENTHKNGILRTSKVPAEIDDATRAAAKDMARRILEALDYVGVIGVELFQTGDTLLVNEIAPRVHNTGHWTMDGCVPDQFEAHIRAVVGWPLPEPVRTADVLMENLIGDDMAQVDALRAEPGVAIHLYGKAEVREGRKMGHINRVKRR